MSPFNTAKDVGLNHYVDIQSSKTYFAGLASGLRQCGLFKTEIQCFFHSCIRRSRYTNRNVIVSLFGTQPRLIIRNGLKLTMPARLLIVDDHEVVRLGLRALFANNGSFEICGEAQNGIEAVRMVLDMSPDVVILDLTMPGMNGFEAAANIVTVAPSIKIVFFSAHEVPATAQWVGADAFVSKSSALEELLLTVCRVLQSGTNVRSKLKSMSAANISNP